MTRYINTALLCQARPRTMLATRPKRVPAYLHQRPIMQAVRVMAKRSGPGSGREKAIPRKIC